MNYSLRLSRNSIKKSFKVVSGKLKSGKLKSGK